MVYIMVLMVLVALTAALFAGRGVMDAGDPSDDHRVQPNVALFQEHYVAYGN